MSTSEHRGARLHRLLLLSHSDVASLLQSHGLGKLVDDLVLRLEHEFAQAAEPGRVTVPPRDGVANERGRHPSLVEWMPSDRVEGDTCLKIVGYHPENPRRFGLPTILATISLIDGETGAVKAIVDGTILTCLRTAASSVVASRLLANPASSVLGLIGCGAQAVAHVHALVRFFPLQRVLICDVNPETQRSFASRLRDVSRDLEIVPASADEVRAQSDILCTATTTRPGDPPVFSDGECQPHLHVNAVGSDFPGKLEVPRSLLERALVIPDFAEQAFKEGECQQMSREETGPELCKLSADPEAWRGYRDRLTVFDSTGWALEDQVIAEQFYALANKAGAGHWVTMEDLGADPLDPFEFLATPERAPNHPIPGLGSTA